MPSLADLRFTLTILTISAYAAILLKIFHSGLETRYRNFTIYVAWEILRVSLSLAIPFRTTAYAYFYFVTQPITWVMFVMVLLELFQLVLRNHSGIATLGRKVLSGSLVLSVVASTITLFLDLQQRAPLTNAFLDSFMLLERLVLTSLLILLLCLTAMFSFFPVPLTSNVRLHACVFAAYFGVKTVLLWIRTAFGVQVINSLNLATQITALACLVTWAIWLRRSGEETPEPKRLPEDAEHHLLRQLDALNHTLLRSVRK